MKILLFFRPISSLSLGLQPHVGVPCNNFHYDSYWRLVVGGSKRPSIPTALVIRMLFALVRFVSLKTRSGRSSGYNYSLCLLQTAICPCPKNVCSNGSMELLRT